MGDVDLWAVVDEGKALTVNAKWLQHLQVCTWADGGASGEWQPLRPHATLRLHCDDYMVDLCTAVPCYKWGSGRRVTVTLAACVL